MVAIVYLPVFATKSEFRSRIRITVAIACKFRIAKLSAGLQGNIRTTFGTVSRNRSDPPRRFLHIPRGFELLVLQKTRLLRMYCSQGEVCCSGRRQTRQIYEAQAVETSDRSPLGPGCRIGGSRRCDEDIALLSSSGVYQVSRVIAQ